MQYVTYDLSVAVELVGIVAALVLTVARATGVDAATVVARELPPLTCVQLCNKR
jgi:hypothetical protein